MTIQFSGMDQTLRNSIEASVRTYLLYHSGALAEFGLGQDNADRLADIAPGEITTRGEAGCYNCSPPCTK